MKWYNSRKRILVVIHLAQPIWIQKMMTSRTMCHRSNKTVTMGTSSPDSIKATGTKTPDCDMSHIKLRSLRHVIQHTRPQTIRGLGVSWISGRIGCTRNLNNNSCPAAIGNLVCTLTVVGSVAVQSSHDQDDWNRMLTRFIWNANIDRNPRAIVTGGVLVWNYFLFDDGVPQRCCLQVDILLTIEGDPLDGGFGFTAGAHVRKA